MKEKRKARKITSLILSFLLTIIVTTMMLTAGFRLGVCNKEIFVQNMIDNTYYEALYEDMENNLKLFLWEASLPVILAEDVFQESQIYIDGKNYVNAALDGKEPEIKTTKIEKKLRQNIENYLEENGQDISKMEPEIEKILKRTVSDYQQKTASPLADYFYQFQSWYSRVANIVLITGTVLCLIILFFLLKMYHRKYRAFRYVVYVITASTIANTIYTWHLTRILTMGNVVSGTGDYYRMADTFLKEAGMQGYYISLAGMVVIAVMLLMIRIMKKKYK